MPFVTGQLATLGTVATTLFTSPPGEGTVTIVSGTASAATAYIGLAGTGVTTTNGYPLDPGHSFTFAQYVKSPGGVVSAIGGGSPCTIGWIVSRP